MTETRSGAADDTRAAPSAIADVKDAMHGFLSEFNRLRDDMKAKFQKQEERIAMLNTKMTTHSRPALSAQIDQAAPHKKALASYLRNGDDDALRGLEIERKERVDPTARDLVRCDGAGGRRHHRRGTKLEPWGCG